MEEGERREIREGSVTMEGGQSALAGFAGGGRGHKPRNTDRL